MMGFMLGVLIRNSAGAIVGYFVYSLVCRRIFELLASDQDSFADVRGWIDFSFSSPALRRGSEQHRLGPTSESPASSG